MALPDRGWPAYEDALRGVAERRSSSSDAKQCRFLRELGFVTDDLAELTESGSTYFTARFLREDYALATDLLRAALLAYPPAAAIAQVLFGVPNSSRSKAEMVLRHHGLADDLNDRKLGSLLGLMHTAELVQLSSRGGEVHVLVAPSADPAAPPSIFVGPETPYGNKAWLRRILAESAGQIQWLDKHFMPVAFDAIWEAVDGSMIASVQILSLRLADHEGRRPLRNYRDLVAELKNRGVVLRWHTIDSTLVKATHDRWIIDEKSARNVPNVNAIYSGQHSEMTSSSNLIELQKVFDTYWEQSKPFDSQQT